MSTPNPRWTRETADQVAEHIRIEMGSDDAARAVLGYLADAGLLVSPQASAVLEAAPMLFAFWDTWHNKIALFDPSEDDKRLGVVSLLMGEESRLLDDASAPIETRQVEIRAAVDAYEASRTDTER